MSVDEKNSESEDYQILYRVSTRNIILDVLKSRKGWRETTSEVEWDLNWADTTWIKDNLGQLRLDSDQKLNHFRNHYELSRKDLLAKNLKR
eukprot:maker-scaffold_15-snap-gene-2.24-mRNA-1 protein AED:0.49 eAED:0.49 QI:0/0/0/1/0/0/2/0/90